MRSILFSLLLSSLSTVAFADNWSHQWTVAEQPDLRVEAGDGRIQMSASSGNRIEASIVTTGWKIAPGEVTITERQEGNRVELEVHVPKNHFSIGWPGSRGVEVELRVPTNASAFLHTGDGSIRINGMRGKIDARTGDGSIEAMDIDGTFDGHSGDGHIHVRGRLDNLSLETGDGGIEAELTTGSRMNSAWRMHTGDGHVTLRVPRDLHADLDAHTGDGSITVDLPITLQGVTKSRNDVHGKINGGGEVLTIRTGDGAIRIEHS